MNEKVEEVILREARDAHAQAVEFAQSQQHIVASREFGRLVGFERVLWLLGKYDASSEVAGLIDDLLKMDKQEYAA